MPHIPLYVSVSTFKNSVEIPGTAADPDIERALGAASRAIEKVTSRRFWLDEEEATRKYTALSRDLVVIDDIADIQSVSVAGSELSVDSWFAEPSNNPHNGEPFLWIESEGAFSTRRQAVEVTGKFGWPEVPDQVSQIVVVTANKMLKRAREAPWGLIATGFDGLALRITRDDPDVSFLVEPLMRAETRRS